MLYIEHVYIYLCTKGHRFSDFSVQNFDNECNDTLGLCKNSTKYGVKVREDSVEDVCRKVKINTVQFYQNSMNNIRVYTCFDN